MNIDTKRVRRDLSILRDWLGVDAATGQPHIPEATKSNAAKLLGCGAYEVNGLPYTTLTSSVGCESAAKPVELRVYPISPRRWRWSMGDLSMRFAVVAAPGWSTRASRTTSPSLSLM